MANFFRQSKLAGLDRLQKFAMHAHALDARMDADAAGNSRQKCSFCLHCHTAIR